MRTIPIAIALLIGLTSSVRGQNISLDDPPKLLPKATPTRKELDRRESLYQYVFGINYLHERKIDEALKAFEAAARLDPQAPAYPKAQAPILIGLGRHADALAACQRVVALDADDYQAWYVQAKLFKSLVKYDEAIRALESGLKASAIPDHPEVAQLFNGELGGLYETLERFAPAADAYTRAAELLDHPDLIAAKGHVPREAVLARAAETYEKIGSLYRKAGRYPDAIAALRKAQERAPARSARLSYTLAQVCTEHGDLKQALECVDVYLRTQPLSTEPHELKINLLRRLKQDAAIVPWLEQSVERDRFNTQLQALLTKEYVAARQFRKAETLYKKLVDDSPSPELYRGLFNIYKEEGQLSMLGVLEMLDKVMDKSAREDGPTPIGTVQHARAMIGALESDAELGSALIAAASSKKLDLKFDTVLFLAMLADRQRKNDEAELFYRHCLGGKDVNLRQEAQIYAGLLRVLGNARKHEAMVKVCQDGIQKSRSLKAWYFYKELARAQASLHRHDDALESIELGRKEAGDDNRLIFDLMRLRILTAAARYADAEAECVALLKKTERPGEIIELRYLMSGLYTAGKQLARAEEQLQLILKIDPDNVAVNNDLGYLWADQGKNLAVAEAMIRKALEIDRLQRRRNPNFQASEDKDNAAYVDSLGWVLFRRGRFEEARQELERAAALDGGDDPTIHDHLGDVYDHLKMRPEATRAWQRALELYDRGVRGKDDDRVRAIRRKIEMSP